MHIQQPLCDLEYYAFVYGRNPTLAVTGCHIFWLSNQLKLRVTQKKVSNSRSGWGGYAIIISDVLSGYLLEILSSLDARDIAIEDDCPDDSDILSSLIIQEVLGINISATEGDANMTEIRVSVARVDESGGIIAATEEDICAWNNGERWGNELPTVPDNK